MKSENTRRSSRTSVPQRVEQGREAFNRGEYFHAHEIWEEAWRELEGAERVVVQGLIQIAAGLHHLQRRRPRPATGLLRKGLEKLSRTTPASLVHVQVEVLAHVQVEVLARDVARLLTELETPGATAPNPAALKL